MRKIMLLFVLVCSFQKMHSQELYLKTGRNYTNYDYKNDTGTNVGLQSGSGTFYEIGYVISSDSSVVKYSVVLSLNEYNAVGANATNASWNTEYAGIENYLTYSFVRKNGFDVGVKGGLGISTIVYGKQELDGSYFDLTSQKEFSGLLLSPKMGLQTAYNINKDVFFSLGYSFSKGFNVTNPTPEKLSFNTHQIQFGINIRMK